MIQAIYNERLLTDWQTYLTADLYFGLGDDGKPRKDAARLESLTRHRYPAKILFLEVS